MEEEIKNTLTDSNANPDEESAVEIISSLKANSVPKEDFEKLKNQYTEALKALAEGREIEGAQSSEEKTTAELREDFFKAAEKGATNAETVEKALALRRAVLAEGGIDPFLPVGARISPTPADIQKAEQLATILQKCLDESVDAATNEVSSELFRANLSRVVNPDSPATIAALKKRGVKF